MNNIDKEFADVSYEQMKQWNEMMNDMTQQQAEREQLALERAEYLTKYYL